VHPQRPCHDHPSANTTDARQPVPGTLATDSAWEGMMQDLIYLGLTALFFALCWGFVRLAERL
jgi:hypothetical protein